MKMWKLFLKYGKKPDIPAANAERTRDREAFQNENFGATTFLIGVYFQKPDEEAGSKDETENQRDLNVTHSIFKSVSQLVGPSANQSVGLLLWKSDSGNEEEPGMKKEPLRAPFSRKF